MLAGAGGRVLRPATVVGLAYLALIALFVVRYGYGPIDFVHLGSVWMEHDPDGDWGYDGQYFYQLARDPLAAHRFMDNAPFRYQRILYPLVVRLLTLGQEALLPLAMLGLNWLAVVLGTECLAALLRDRGLSPWYSLAYGLYFGQATAVTFVLAEPLAYLLVCGSILCFHRRQIVPGSALLGLATLTRETTVLFSLAYLASFVIRRRWPACAWLLLLGVLPLLLWLLALRRLFGQTGVTFTPGFEYLPFAGLLQQSSASGLFALLVILMLVPTVASLGISAWRLLRGGLHPLLLAWGLNLLVVTFLSHYSYLELVSSGRIAIGAVLAATAYGATTRDLLVLRASLYHLFGFGVYLLAVWLGARSLIIR